MAEERLRIARELHDVVAHAMSVVAVQSGVAAHVIDSGPDEAKQMLENISATSRDALDEMRRLLGVLRPDDRPTRPAWRRRPRWTQLDDLVGTHRRPPGSQVRPGGRRRAAARCRPGVDLSAYRIVQEALTNVLKHAGHASARGAGALRARPGHRGDRRRRTRVRRRPPTRRRQATGWSACASGSAVYGGHARGRTAAGRRVPGAWPGCPLTAVASPA